MELDLWEGLPNEGSASYDHMISFCISHAGDVRKGLPWFAAEVAEANGWAAMLNFVKRHSGTQVYVPAEIDDFNDRYGLSFTPVQYRRVVRLADDRRTICVPSAWGVYMALRRVALRQALIDGVADRSIARRFGASVRYVKKERSRILVGG